MVLIHNKEYFAFVLGASLPVLVALPRPTVASVPPHATMPLCSSSFLSFHSDVICGSIYSNNFALRPPQSPSERQVLDFVNWFKIGRTFIGFQISMLGGVLYGCGARRCQFLMSAVPPAAMPRSRPLHCSL